MITFSWLMLITVLAAGFALFDAIGRLRGRSSNILAIVQLIAAILMLATLFIAIPGGTLLFAIILEIVLLIMLLTGGRGNRISIITLIALVLNTIVIVVALGWVTIPAIQ